MGATPARGPGDGGGPGGGGAGARPIPARLPRRPAEHGTAHRGAEPRIGGPPVGPTGAPPDRSGDPAHRPSAVAAWAGLAHDVCAAAARGAMAFRPASADLRTPLPRGLR